MPREIAYLALFALIFMSVDSFANAPTGRILFTKGTVEIISKDGKKSNAKKGQAFTVGQTIKTGPKSFAVLKLQDDSKVKLDPSTVVKVDSLIQKNKKGHTGKSSFILSVGGAMVDVLKVFSGPPSLEIKTKKGVSNGVRGTIFYTRIDPKKDNLWTMVRYGRVLVMDYNNDDSESIKPGRSVVVLDGTKLTSPYTYNWTSKMKWNMKERGDLNSRFLELQEDREEELKKVIKKITKRKKKPFKKLMEALEERVADEELDQQIEWIEDEHLHHVTYRDLKNKGQEMVVPDGEVPEFSIADVEFGEDSGDSTKGGDTGTATGTSTATGTVGQGTGGLVLTVPNAHTSAQALCAQVTSQTGFSCTTSTIGCTSNQQLEVGKFISQAAGGVITVYACMYLPSYHNLPSL